MQGLRHGDVGVRQLDILADDGDLDALLRVVDLIDHLLPIAHVSRTVVHVELLERDLVETFLLHHQRDFVDCRRCAVLDDSFRLHVAEHGNLVLHLLGDRLLRAADEDVRLDADGAQLLDAVLRRLRLELASCRDVRQERDMDVERIVRADFLLDLADGLEERLALDIADRTADLRDDDISAVCLRHVVDLLLDLVRDVRDDLHGMTLILTVTLLVQNGPVHLTGGDIAPVIQGLVDEALVVTEVEVGLRTIIRDKDLAVLVRTHRARIDVDIRIEFLDRDLDSPALEETAERCGRDALAQGRNNATGNENILCHGTASCLFFETHVDYSTPNRTGVSRHRLFPVIPGCSRASSCGCCWPWPLPCSSLTPSGWRASA